MGSARARRGRHGGGGHRLRGGHRAPPLDAAARSTLPVLPAGARPIKVLHVSDLHITPGQRSKQRWVAALGRAGAGPRRQHRRQPRPPARRPRRRWPRSARCSTARASSSSAATTTSARRSRTPPATCGRAQKRNHGTRLPWRDLRAALLERGWLDATHTRHTLTAGGLTVAAAGVDDPHIRLDRYDRIAGHAPGSPDLRLGLTHSPEPRVLDGFAADGYDLVLAGHTHGGQLRLPGYGAIVTNCGIDRSRARGASRWGAHMWLHVSAGLGTAPDRAGPLRLPARGQPADARPPPHRPGRRRRPPPQRRWRTSARLATRGIGVWRSLVARFVRDEEVAGSNPVTPTNKRPGQSNIDQAVVDFGRRLSDKAE